MVAADPKIYFVLTFLNPEDYLHYGVKGWAKDISKELIEAKRTLDKAFAVVFLQGQNVDVFRSILQIQRECLKEGVACFSSLDAAIKAISKLITYYQNRDE